MQPNYVQYMCPDPGESMECLQLLYKWELLKYTHIDTDWKPTSDYIKDILPPKCNTQDVYTN